MTSRTLPHDAVPREAPPASQAGWRQQAWWGWLKRGLTLAFFAVVGIFIFRYARNVDWQEVWAAITGTPAGVLALAAGLALSSHLMVSSFDLFGRRHTGHPLSVGQVVQVNFISYAFNLNLGSLVGAVALRYRLYSRLGLDTPTITKVLTLSMLTNWLGYLVLAGAIFLVAPLELPPSWKMSSDGLQWLGGALLAVAAGYLYYCVVSKRSSMTLRGHEIELPSPRMAGLQLLVSVTNWMVMGAIIFTLLQGKAGYLAVLSVLLVGAVAGVITHVPAGLGVLEGVFIALLSHQVPEWQLLAALLTYRGLYYIAPLALAAVLYLVVEARARPAAAA